LTPTTDLGAEAVAAYAAAQGLDADAFVAGMGAVVTPESLGRCVIDLLTSSDWQPAYAVTADGLRGLG
jgi:hypothetical protein